MATLLDQLDTINVMTRRYVSTSPNLRDYVFNQDPFLYYLRDTLQESFDGGSSINENFISDVLPGGPYLKGKTFDVSNRQTEFQCRFDIRTSQISVTLFAEDYRVFNKGALAVTKLLQGRIDQGFMGLGGSVAVGSYLPGISQPGYEPNVIGLAEALNDGSVQSWNGGTYPVYGGLTRSTFGRALTSTPINAAGVGLPYQTIDLAYSDVMYGSGQYEPNLMLTTPRGLSFLKAKYQTQQRFTNASIGDAKIGFKGLEFNNAVVLASRYCPGGYVTGLVDGIQDKVAANFLTQMSEGAITTYPTGNLGTTSANCTETLFILNARKPFINYYVSSDEVFGGGFREFIPESNGTRVVGQVLLAHALTVSPRYHKQIYNFKAA